MSAINAWLITGVVVGGLAHLLVPGCLRIGRARTPITGIISTVTHPRSRRTSTVGLAAAAASTSTSDGPEHPAPAPAPDPGRRLARRPGSFHLRGLTAARVIVAPQRV